MSRTRSAASQSKRSAIASRSWLRRWPERRRRTRGHISALSEARCRRTKRHVFGRSLPAPQSISFNVRRDAHFLRSKQSHRAEYDRLVALRMKAGPSNPQQGCVGTKRAKVQRKTRIAGTIRGLAIWTLSPECENLGRQTFPRLPLQSGVPTQAASVPSAMEPFL